MTEALLLAHIALTAAAVVVATPVALAARRHPDRRAAGDLQVLTAMLARD